MDMTNKKFKKAEYLYEEFFNKIGLTGFHLEFAEGDYECLPRIHVYLPSDQIDSGFAACFGGQKKWTNFKRFITKKYGDHTVHAYKIVSNAVTKAQVGDFAFLDHEFQDSEVVLITSIYVDNDGKKTFGYRGITNDDHNFQFSEKESLADGFCKILSPEEACQAYLKQIEKEHLRAIALLENTKNYACNRIKVFFENGLSHKKICKTVEQIKFIQWSEILPDDLLEKTEE